MRELLIDKTIFEENTLEKQNKNDTSKRYK
jgi:hypothetical protein